jgi:hypothetical protein
MFTAYLQFLGKQYSATGQDLPIFFETKDLVSTRNWKAASAALDRNQPTTKLGQGLLNRGTVLFALYVPLFFLNWVSY